MFKGVWDLASWLPSGGEIRKQRLVVDLTVFHVRALSRLVSEVVLNPMRRRLLKQEQQSSTKCPVPRERRRG